MSTRERVNKQIQALAANSKFLTSIIQENEVAQIQKNVDLLKQAALVETTTASAAESGNDSNVVFYSDKELIFDSMLQLTNFILYNDYPNESKFQLVLLFTFKSVSNRFQTQNKCEYAG